MSALIKKTNSLAVALSKESASKTVVSGSNTETLIICLDTSGSMRDLSEGHKTRMVVAIEAAQALIKSCGIVSHIGAVAFHDQPECVVDPGKSRSFTLESIGGFAKFEGGTRFAPAVKVATNLIATHQWGSIKRIIFMSDGEDQSPPEELDAAVNACAAAKIIIDTVMFGHSPEGERTLRRMSEKTGGVYVLAKDAASLRRTFMSLEAGARGLLTGGKK